VQSRLIRFRIRTLPARNTSYERYGSPGAHTIAEISQRCLAFPLSHITWSRQMINFLKKQSILSCVARLQRSLVFACGRALVLAFGVSSSRDVHCDKSPLFTAVNP